ncbi:hypothetical protein FQA39_LY03779 [Lamprigera yunnana]|nr:hypothetical protein FQA39_LY03779 [Lamprigera yunnana]
MEKDEQIDNSMTSRLLYALPQILAVMVKNCLMLSFGMNLGFSTILIGGLLEKNSEIFYVNQNQISWIGSMSLLTIPFGSVLSGILTQPFGRKRSMQFITIPFIICWIVFYLSKELWHIYLALGFMGFFGGLVEAPFSAYVSEITQPHLRGTLSITGSIAVLLGVFIQFMLGTFYRWRTCAIISCTFPIITFILFFFVPESPYWLILNNKMDEAKKGLAWLRGWAKLEDVEIELQEIFNRHVIRKNGNCLNAVSTSSSQLSIEKVKPFLKKSFFWPFGIVVFTMILAQFDGSSTLQTYAISIFATLNVPINTYYATLMLAGSQFVAGIVSAIFIHRVGRRKMTFISLAGVTICNTCIGIYAYVHDVKNVILINENETVNDLNAQNWIPLTLLMLLSFLDHCGMYMLPWVLIGELYSYDTRSVGCGISSAVSYLINFTSNNLFLRTVSGLTMCGAYILYGIISFVGIIVLYYILPETEGKTLEEISDHFAGLSKLGNEVGRKHEKFSVSGTTNPVFNYEESKIRDNQIVSSKL